MDRGFSKEKSWDFFYTIDEHCCKPELYNIDIYIELNKKNQCTAQISWDKVQLLHV